MKWRKRIERIDDIVSRIIASCIDKQEFNEHGISYINGNEEFAHDVLNVVNCIKDRLGRRVPASVREQIVMREVAISSMIHTLQTQHLRYCILP